jgi:hypothetical protein
MPGSQPLGVSEVSARCSRQNRHDRQKAAASSGSFYGRLDPVCVHGTCLPNTPESVTYIKHLGRNATETPLAQGLALERNLLLKIVHH